MRITSIRISGIQLYVKVNRMLRHFSCSVIYVGRASWTYLYFIQGWWWFCCKIRNTRQLKANNKNFFASKVAPTELIMYSSYPPTFLTRWKLWLVSLRGRFQFFVRTQSVGWRPFLRSVQAKSCTVPYIRIWAPPSTSFPIRYSISCSQWTPHMVALQTASLNAQPRRWLWRWLTAMQWRAKW